MNSKHLFLTVLEAEKPKVKLKALILFVNGVFSLPVSERERERKRQRERERDREREREMRASPCN